MANWLNKKKKVLNEKHIVLETKNYLKVIKAFNR